MADGSLDYRRFEPDGETVVRILGPDAAVLRYRAAIVVAFAGGGDAGRFWHTDIYERREGGWQAVWSQATLRRAPPVNNSADACASSSAVPALDVELVT
ncbi:MAG: nuclear transport factor 2 family protein, partial [Chloroflexota bacterium]